MPLPDAGDIVWVEFDAVRGTEQAGRRPGLVLTPLGYHEHSPRAVVCPITSNIRPWPFKVILPTGLRTQGAVLVDQVRAVDRAQRVFATIEIAPGDVVAQVRAKLAALLGIDPGVLGSGPQGI
jgi:mRNA interferase MazF